MHVMRRYIAKQKKNISKDKLSETDQILHHLECFRLSCNTFTTIHVVVILGDKNFKLDPNGPDDETSKEIETSQFRYCQPQTVYI